MKSCSVGLCLACISESLFLPFFSPFLLLMHASAPVVFAELAQLWSRGLAGAGVGITQGFARLCLAGSCVSHTGTGMCRCPQAQALGVMGNEKRVQHDSGVCSGSIKRASFSCKLRLEIEAWKHGKSAISRSLLKSFFTSSSCPCTLKWNLVFSPLGRELVAWGMGRE